MLNKQRFKLTSGFYTKSNPRKGFTPVLGDWIKGLVLNFSINLWCKTKIKWPNDADGPARRCLTPTRPSRCTQSRTWSTVGDRCRLLTALATSTVVVAAGVVSNTPTAVACLYRARRRSTCHGEII